MNIRKPYIHNHPIQNSQKEVLGYLNEMDGESMYCIENYDHMDPFFMSIVSSSDLWMFISSNGSLTAGRQNYNNALFPYYTDDKIHDSDEITGPKTIIRINDDGKLLIWEPFSTVFKGFYDINRNIYKNIAGNKIIFSETNNDLQLRFSYSWMNSEKLGWIRKCCLSNLSSKHFDIDITDGLLNIIPYGITRDTQSMMSTLMDAYKVAELVPGTSLALFRMSSIPIDRAEPSEALRTNCVWSCGLNSKRILLSAKQLQKIRQGMDVEPELNVFGVKTAYLIHDKLRVAPNQIVSWYMVADVAKDSTDIVALNNLLAKQTDLASFIEKCVAESSKKLHNLVELADGVQITGDKLNDRRHFANVMFNIMRGGIFEKEYEIDLADFLKHIEQSNIKVYQKFRNKFNGTRNQTSLDFLLKIAKESNDRDLQRITLEYLPLSFSRRHGDPSRPWNFFDINVKNPDGSSSLNYQGNWRDIFQNWEALGFSFPEFLPSMICRFLNASTADGYNPYRITREGFDWEVPEPENPWAYIGYWGDHQIIYLLKLLELFENFYPDETLKVFQNSVFVYANVPYRIKPYTEILADPQNTITFERNLHEQIVKKSDELGADGKLLFNSNGEIIRASFIEKILVSLLTKVSNFVPEGGIWLNTQRPEWNDANNALVGHGASMVTLYQLRRYVEFFAKLVAKSDPKEFKVSSELFQLYQNIFSTLDQHQNYISKGFSDEARKQVTDSLGMAGSEYRTSVYKGFSGKTHAIQKENLLNLFEILQQYINGSIEKNRRSDGLFHSYNLLEFSEKSLKVQNLQLMLEGQAAVLSSGYLSITETNKVLDALFQSNLWRNDQQSFLLYPFKELPSFMDMNNIPLNRVGKSKLLRKLISLGDKSIIVKDEDGHYHFNPDLRNAQVLKERLSRLKTVDKELIDTEMPLALDIYESVFQHRYFTGRSGSFYKYEGLGSIYWHLVSKLLYSTGDSIKHFVLSGIKNDELEKLISFYHKIKEGIGVHKNPKTYGAFPTDPYSHTPSMMGAQQPGMTGQVKEDILSRFNELGLFVQNGEINIQPIILHSNDFYQKENSYSLDFNYCSTQFFYQKSEKNGIEIRWKDQKSAPTIINSNSIPNSIALKIFRRTKEIDQIVVNL